MTHQPSVYRIGVIGLGKIAQDQHLPVIAANPDFTLVAVASQRGLTVQGARAVREPDELLAMADVDCVAICTPPQARHRIAAAALMAGKDVMLEKPPTATLSELSDLARRARDGGRVLMTTWHSQYNAAVEAARARLAGETVTELFVDWRESVRKWHPGQAWIWQPGGFGVFDPGINALSIVTRILPRPLFVTACTLETPANAAAPIAARLEFGSRHHAVFDWREEAGETWEITLRTGSGRMMKLARGGARLELDGELVVDQEPAEYARIYERFATLLAARTSLVDTAPFELVADAFLLGRRVEVSPFVD